VDLISLHLPKLTLLHDLGGMNGFTMSAARIDPLAYGLSLRAISGFNRDNRTPVRDQGDDTVDGLLVSAAAEEDRTGRSLKVLPQTLQR
jgi:hypothetical protein